MEDVTGVNITLLAMVFDTIGSGNGGFIEIGLESKPPGTFTYDTYLSCYIVRHPKVTTYKPL